MYRAAPDSAVVAFVASQHTIDMVVVALLFLFLFVLAFTAVWRTSRH